MSGMITRPPELEVLSRDDSVYSVWYVFKESSDRYPEKGPYAAASSQEHAQEQADNHNKKNPDAEYNLIVARTTTVVEAM